MSMCLDETANLAVPKSNKIYDLKSQLSMKKRNDSIIVTCKKQFIYDFFLALFSVASILVVYFEVLFI